MALNGYCATLRIHADYPRILRKVIGGAFLGSLMLALLKNLNPERTGLINRWHYFFWHLWDPETHPLDSRHPYSLPCPNSHAMKVLIV
jgi:hypothetical protein